MTSLTREECEQVQTDEKLALEAIYGDDAQILSNTVWKIWKPLEVRVSLRPIESESKRSSKVFASLDLHVTCSPNYPNVLPTLSFEREKGVWKNDLEELKQKLMQKGTESLGQAMIMEFCEIVRQFLYEKNKPPPGSFHDGMIRGHEKGKMEQRRQRLNSEQKEWDEYVEGQERRKLEAEWKREEMQERQRSESCNRELRTFGAHKVLVLDPSPAGHKRKTNYCTEWSGTCQEQTVLVSDWTFEYTLGRKDHKRTMPDFSKFLERLAVFESFSSSLVELNDVDSSIVPYVFIQVDKIAVTQTCFNMRIHVGQQVASADMNVQGIAEKIQNDPSALRRLATSCVCALRWLHDQQFAHGAVDASCLWTDDYVSFRLGDWRIWRSLTQLSELFKAICEGKDAESLISTWDEQHKNLRKKDLFAVGSLLDTLCASSLDDSCDASSHLSSFIKACQSAKTCDPLVDHPYLTSDPFVLNLDGSSISGPGVQEVGGAKTRLGREFYIMKSLGKGGFGEVLLARNKLDQVHYAVKVIPLDPRSEKLNQKITKEAKLFAKLTHHNVVRYYCAWTDNAPHSRPSQHSGNKDTAPSRKLSKSKRMKTPFVPETSSTDDSLLPSKLRNLGKVGNIQEDEDWDAEWTTSFRETRSVEDLSSDEDDLPHFLFSPTEEDDDFEILFEASDSPLDENDNVGVTSDDKSVGVQSDPRERTPHRSDRSKETSTVPTKTALTVDTAEVPPTRMLYIQMEYCAKGTLRSLIDSRALVNNSKYAWQIFGEILSGLDYIHSRGLIHRDIKPMNILLDANNHVKIGDFGLATKELRSETGHASLAGGDSNQTMDIGTELYMAPELLAPTPQHQPYNAKIDIYSTGIVLFEMFYRPLPPGLQRISTIRALKEKGLVPEDFASVTPVQSGHAHRLIEWMMKVNPDERPTVRTLLSGDHLPAVEVDGLGFQKMFTQTLKKRSGRLFDWMMEKLTSGESTHSAQNYSYDQAMCQRLADEKDVIALVNRERVIYHLCMKMQHCLTVRAFTPLHCHLLCPAKEVSALTPSSRKPYTVVDQSAMAVALPIDLRLNFMRYCTRNNIIRMKRFAIGKVFTSKEIFGGVHPTERWEMSIDAVCPSSSIRPIEIQVISAAIAVARSALGERCKLTLRLGHMGLLDAIFSHLNINTEERQGILEKLNEISIQQPSVQERIEMLSEVGGSKVATAFLAHLHSEMAPNLFSPYHLPVGQSDLSFLCGHITCFREECRSILRSRDDNVRNNTKDALSDLEKLFDAFADLNVEIELCSSLVYRPKTFRDGVIFQIRAQVLGKKRTVPIVAGGRYDSLLSSVRHSSDRQPPRPLCVVGCAVNMEVIANLHTLQKDGDVHMVSTVICSYGRTLTVEKMELARKLWDLGVSTDVYNDQVENLAVVQERCDSVGQNLLVMFDSDQVLVRLGGSDYGKVDRMEALDLTYKFRVAETSGVFDPVPVIPRPTTPSKSGTAVTSKTPSNTAPSFSNVNITWAVVDKPSHNLRKKQEGQCRNILTDSIRKFSTQTRIDVVLTELPADILMAAASRIELHSTHDELVTIFDQMTKFHGKAKEELETTYSVLLNILCPRGAVLPNVLILFTTQGNTYRIIM